MSPHQHPSDFPPSYSSSSPSSPDAVSRRDNSYTFSSVSAAGLSPPPALKPLEPTLNPSPASRNPLDAARQEAAAAARISRNSTPSSSTPTTVQSPSQWSVTSHASGVDTALPLPDRATSAMSVDTPTQKRATSASLDDANDRMAAEALCGLGKITREDSATPSYTARSPSGYETPLKYYPIGIEHTRPGATTEAPEPLLSLLTTSHPWLGGTINSSINAYSSTKSYTPRIIQYGAGLVENTVGSVGRKTGVEGSIRRYLGARRSSNESERMNPNILRHDESGGLDMIAEQNQMLQQQQQQPLQSPMMLDKEFFAANGVPAHRTSSIRSVETLPPYDENKSPPYEEANFSDMSGAESSAARPRFRTPVNRSWSRQLMISTSGLGVALSDSSLRSLKYTLTILSKANNHVRQLMELLKKLMKEYHDNEPQAAEEGRAAGSGDANAMSIDSAGDPSATAQSIHKLNQEIWNTLKHVVNVISRYTGGTLPENASAVVRWQLMSVPQRWQRAVSQSGQPDQPSSVDDAVASGNRMMAFAIEGLDMMDQVGGVVDSTITSAERWLDSMGRRKKTQPTEGEPTSQTSDTTTPQPNGSASENTSDQMEGIQQDQSRS